MDTYKVLKAIQNINSSFDTLVTADEISSSLGKTITDNDLIYFDRYITKGFKTINGETKQAYCLLLQGYEYISNYEQDIKDRKLNHKTYIISILTLIFSIIAVIIAIIGLL